MNGYSDKIRCKVTKNPQYTKHLIIFLAFRTPNAPQRHTPLRPKTTAERRIPLRLSAAESIILSFLRFLRGFQAAADKPSPHRPHK